jgi:hypothetical protein
MDEIGYSPPVGRKPLPNEDGERLQKYAVKLFPSQWAWLLEQGNASEWLRERIEDSRCADPRAKFEKRKKRKGEK